MAAFALHAAVVIFGAYSMSGAVLAGVVIIAAALRWEIDRKLILPMVGWGAVGVVGMAFAMRTLETFTQG